MSNRTPRNSDVVGDLGDHAAKQVQNTLLRTMNLCENDKDAFVVGTFGVAACLGLAAAAYSKHYGTDKKASVEAVLEAVRSFAGAFHQEGRQ